MKSQRVFLTVLHMLWEMNEWMEKYVYPTVRAEVVMSGAITEPDAGSDVMAIKSRAEDKGDHWLLNGSKTWISNADVADVIFLALI